MIFYGHSSVYFVLHALGGILAGLDYTGLTIPILCAQGLSAPGF